MQESRPILGPSMDIDWPRRRTLLNRCLLAVALLLAAFGIGSMVLQADMAILDPFSPTVLLIASAVWILLAYIFSRAQRLRTSGWLIVIFALIWLGLGLYLLPDYTLSLLPAAVLPIALAVLLLDGIGTLLVMALTVGTILVLTSGFVPLASPGSRLPLTGEEFGVTVVCVCCAMLALVLLPLRGAYSALIRRVGEQEVAISNFATERSTFEQAQTNTQALIEQQRQHLAEFAAVVRDGAISVNEAGTIIRANLAARQIAADLVRGDPLGETLAQVEASLVAREGAPPRVELIALPNSVLTPEESFSHVLIDHRDQARLARLRGELLGLLTDEMRNPLTSMVTALDLTLGQNNLPEEVDRVLLGARQSGQRLLDLVTMLLDISQIEQNPDVLRRSSVSLVRLIEAGIAQLSPLAQRGAITVSVEHSGDSTVAVDGERIQRAFSFLLEQSLRQSPPYSVVIVRSRRSEGQLLVQISDQSAGRATQQTEQVFRQGADERGVASLGLIYSKLVIEAHGGRVWAENNSGQGTTYSFALPTDRQQLLK